MAAPLTAAFRRLVRDPRAAAGDPELLDAYRATGDPAAFAALLNRHGPMVFGLCRRWLRDRTLAEDVFQATFLVLARRAGAIRRGESLASFLHGVAARLARQARLSEQARRRREAHVARPDVAPGDPGRDEILVALDEELGRLPADERSALVACYLKGMTQDEAARHLGWSLSTLRRRLHAGRERLRGRLGRRGVSLGASLLPVAAAGQAVPEALRQACLGVVFADATGAGVPAAVALLANGGGSVLTLTKSLLAALLLGLMLSAAALYSPAKLVAPPDKVVEPLPAGAVARLGTTAFRHGRLIWNRSLNYTTDGKHLLSTGGGWVRRWDAETGAELVAIGDGWRVHRWGTEFASADGKLARLGFSPERADGTSEWQCKAFDLETGRELRQFRIAFPERTNSAHSMPREHSPDGKASAEINDPGNLTIWNSDGEVLHHIRPIRSPFAALTYTPDGKHVLVGDDDHFFSLFDLTTGGLMHTFGINRKDNRVHRMAVSPDGRWLATAGGTKAHNPPIHPHDRFVRLWDLKTSEVVHTLDVGETSGVQSLVFTPDGKAVYASLREPKMDERVTVRGWDVATGKPLRTWADASVGETLAMRPDGKRLATMSGAGVIRQWDLATGNEYRPQRASPVGLQAVTFADRGATIRTLGADGRLRAWDAATGALLRTADGEVTGIFPTFQGRGASLWTTIGDKEWKKFTQKRYDPDSGKGVDELAGGLVLEDARGKVLAHVDRDDRLRIVDRATGKLRQTLPVPLADEGSDHRYPIPRGFNAESSRLVVQGEALSVWDVATGKQVSSWDLVAAGIDNWFGRVYVVEVAGKILHQIDLDKVAPECLAFSPDGKRLAVGGPWSVRVWDVATGKPTHTFEGHRGKVTGLAFHPAGRRLASAGDDGNALVWEVTE